MSILSGQGLVSLPGLGTFAVPATLTGLLVLVIGLVILWVIVSLPVYAAGKLITDGRAGLGEAMGATLGGALVYFIVLFGVDYFLGALIGSTAVIFAFVLAILAWLAIYRASFETSWFGAIGIVIVAWLVLVILDLVLTRAFGVALPSFFPF